MNGESYFIRDIGAFPPPVRFSVETGGIERRIFSYFPIGAGSDLSIGVQPYFKSNVSFQKTIDKPIAELTPEQRTIRASEIEAGIQKFAIHKASFHQSGVNNSKSRKGERFPGDSDARSIPFSAITDTIRLFYIYPAAYDKYPLRSPTEKKHHNVFELTESTARIPSMIEMRLSRRGHDLGSKLKAAYPWFGAFVDRGTLNAVDLEIWTVFRRSPNSTFPRDHAMLAEWYPLPHVR